MSDESPITVDSVGGVTVATIRDASVIDPMYVEDLRTELGELVRNPETKSIVLDMSRVEHLSSAALGALITTHESCRENEGKLILTGLCESIRKLLTITKLTGLLNVAESLDDAVAMIQPNPKM